jgi:hypothetical protein
MRLAVDVMGGDHGPEELLQGVKLGLAADPSIFVMGEGIGVRGGNCGVGGVAGSQRGSGAGGGSVE